MQLGDGTLICYGTVPKVSSQGWLTITFPIPFANNNYNVVWGVGYNGDTSISWRVIGCDTRTTTSFITRAFTTATKDYVIVGRWK